MIDCSERIYNNAPPYFSDDGNYLVYDKDWSNNIGFVESESGWRIPKSYLSEKLRKNFLRILKEGEPDEPVEESFTECIERLALQIIDVFNDEIEKFKNFSRDSTYVNYKKGGFMFLDVLNENYISYVLINELYVEKDRLIDAVSIDDDDEDMDDDEYLRQIKHEVEYPGESEEDWKEREEKEKKLLEWMEKQAEKWAESQAKKD